MSYLLFTHDGVPFNYIQRHKGAIRVRLGSSKQNIFVPISYFNFEDNKYQLKKGCNLNWLFNKRDTVRKIQIYKGEMVHD